ncbi:hypothetical protein [Mycolicibacterium wolinskyi]
MLELPTRDAYGNDQLAGMLDFLEYLKECNPGIVSEKVERRIEDERRGAL